MADLPGYGYARASHDERDRWAQFIKAYFESDGALERVLVLIDGRHGPTDLDWEAISYFALSGFPITWVMTKFDGLKTQSDRARRKKEVAEAIKVCQERFRGVRIEPDNQALWVSATSGAGLKELARFLGRKQDE